MPINTEYPLWYYAEKNGRDVTSNPSELNKGDTVVVLGGPGTQAKELTVNEDKKIPASGYETNNGYKVYRINNEENPTPLSKGGRRRVRKSRRQTKKARRQTKKSNRR